MGYFHPVRSVHSVAGHLGKAVGHAASKVKEFADKHGETIAKGAAIGAAVASGASALRHGYDKGGRELRYSAGLGPHVSSIDHGLRRYDRLRESLGV